MPANKQALVALRRPIVPHRVRHTEGSFGYLPHRFLRDGFLGTLGRAELALYVFLILAGNRDGVSFYRYDAICSLLGFNLDDYIAARNALIVDDLIAFDGKRFQVLSLPERPVHSDPTPLASTAHLEASDPAMIRAAILATLDLDK